MLGPKKWLFITAFLSFCFMREKMSIVLNSNDDRCAHYSSRVSWKNRTLRPLIFSFLSHVHSRSLSWSTTFWKKQIFRLGLSSLLLKENLIYCVHGPFLERKNVNCFKFQSRSILPSFHFGVKSKRTASSCITRTHLYLKVSVLIEERHLFYSMLIFCVLYSFISLSSWCKP